MAVDKRIAKLEEPSHLKGNETQLKSKMGCSCCGGSAKGCMAVRSYIGGQNSKRLDFNQLPIRQIVQGFTKTFWRRK